VLITRGSLCTYSSVVKELLWSGTADGGFFGQNLEGLALGPQLANGNWVLLGVVDDGDSFSSNTIVSFELSANPSADFNQDGHTGGADFLGWQRGFGTQLGALLSEGDANRDGAVNSDDLALWAAMLGAPASLATQKTVPEPSTLALGLVAIAALICLPNGNSRRLIQPTQGLENSDKNSMISGSAKAVGGTACSHNSTHIPTRKT